MFFFVGMVGYQVRVCVLVGEEVPRKSNVDGIVIMSCDNAKICQTMMRWFLLTSLTNHSHKLPLRSCWKSNHNSWNLKNLSVIFFPFAHFFSLVLPVDYLLIKRIYMQTLNSLLHHLAHFKLGISWYFTFEGRKEEEINFRGMKREILKFQNQVKGFWVKVDFIRSIKKI